MKLSQKSIANEMREEQGERKMAMSLVRGCRSHFWLLAHRVEYAAKSASFQIYDLCEPWNLSGRRWQ